MTTSLLITQCLQNDFVKPLSKYEPLPNLLHIGYQEAKRLLGEIPQEGPIAKIMEWAYLQDENTLDIIHIRDWHDANDPLQLSHLEQFNSHCLKDTEGAEFIFDNLLLQKRNTNKIINALTLNDFQNTNLESFLEIYKNKPLKVGLIGVWTEAKILFLTYELITRYPNFKIGICSALTASSSVAQHFLSLEKMEKLFGISVFPSVGQFIEFLGGEPLEIPLPVSNKHLKIDYQNFSNLDETDEKLIRYLFRDCSNVSLQSLDGGFSGNLVLGSKSTDILGHQQAPNVIKIGAQDLIGRERASFEKIEHVLGNVAPHIADFADLGRRGAIKYRYASMGSGFSNTFQKLFNTLSIEKIKRILDIVFIEQLGRFYAASKAESYNILEYYAFSAKLAASVRKKVHQILPEQVNERYLNFPNGRQVNNICLFYEEELDKIPETRRDSTNFSYVHGDLNGANIIIDSQENVWLIDFFHTHCGHILKDLIKLENDILYIYTSISSEEEFTEALFLSDYLLDIEDLAQPLSLNISFKNSALNKAFEVIKILRSYYPQLLGIYRNPLQLFAGQMRYAVHTLSFDESGYWQKLWALYMAARCGEKISAYFKKNRLLRIDWLKQKFTSRGHLGLTILPGRKDYERELSEDIEIIKEQGITHIICLISNNEFAHYGVENLFQEYKKVNIEIKHFPVLDQSVVNKHEMVTLIQWIKTNLENGSKILIHCVGGLGRAGTVAACYLKSIGYSFEEAINEVRKTRSPRAIESKVQEEFIKNF